MEDWLRKLASWVDDYKDDGASIDFRYNELTNRHVIELSLRRKERYLAWWMHEMAVALFTRLTLARTTSALKSNTSNDLDKLLRDTGDYLLKWHHRELRSSDFNYPYMIHAQARQEGTTPQSFAELKGLEAYLKPTRMNVYAKYKFFKRLSKPELVTQMLPTVGPFLKRRHLHIVKAFMVTLMVKNRARLVRAELRFAVTRVRYQLAICWFRLQEMVVLKLAKHAGISSDQLQKTELHDHQISPKEPGENTH